MGILRRKDGALNCLFAETEDKPVSLFYLSNIGASYRLFDVAFVCRPFAPFETSTDDLVYCDPPYFSFERESIYSFSSSNCLHQISDFTKQRDDVWFYVSNVACDEVFHFFPKFERVLFPLMHNLSHTKRIECLLFNKRRSDYRVSAILSATSPISSSLSKVISVSGDSSGIQKTASFVKPTPIEVEPWSRRVKKALSAFAFSMTAFA